MEEEIKKIQDSVNTIAKTTAYILENMDVMKSDLKTDIYDLRMEVKSFKKDTDHNVKIIKEDTDDLSDTVMHLDQRLEKLENKFI